MTSMISTSSWNGSPHSKHATTRPRNRSSGSSPPPTWPTSWTDSTGTDRGSPPTQHNPEPPDPRRTYGRDHLGHTPNQPRTTPDQAQHNQDQNSQETPASVPRRRFVLIAVRGIRGSRRRSWSR